MKNISYSKILSRNKKQLITDMHTNMGIFHKHDVESKKSGIEEYDSVYVDLFKLICDLDVRIMLILREILSGRGHK